jgi:hypothetical protein
MATTRSVPNVKHGVFSLPDGPGVGNQRDIDKLDHYKVDHIRGAYFATCQPGWISTRPAY